jgi:cell division protein FtsQ
MANKINVLELPNDIKYINWVTNAFFGLFVLLVIVSGIQYYIKYKINNLNAIAIKGDVIHNDISSIRNQMGSNVRGNFYSIDLIKTKQTFESMSWISQAVVKRVYPSQIEVKLSEFKPKAIWGPREDLKLVDDNGVVFEANADEDEYDQMLQFIGPDGQGKLMLDMSKDLFIALDPLQNKLKTLELNARGSWIAFLEGGAQIELGRGNKADVVERAKKFALGVEQILAKLNKKAIDIQYIDLRHSDGYAMRIHGVTTLELIGTNTAIKK